jgi:hypothetical protein
MVSDELAEPVDAILRHCRKLIDTHHDSAPFAMVRVCGAENPVMAPDQRFRDQPTPAAQPEPRPA